jgi:hypothetical protein
VEEQMAKRKSIGSQPAAAALARIRPVTTAAAGAGPGLVTEGFITITIGTGPDAQQFELRGTVGGHLKVEYHREFADAVDLGTIPAMAGAVAGGLGVGDAAQFQKSLEDLIAQLGAIPGLKEVADILGTLTVKVTDLGIDTQVGKYQFGFGADLSASALSYAGVKLAAFGLLFTYTKPKA